MKSLANACFLKKGIPHAASSLLKIHRGLYLVALCFTQKQFGEDRAHQVNRLHKVTITNDSCLLISCDCKLYFMN